MFRPLAIVSVAFSIVPATVFAQGAPRPVNQPVIQVGRDVSTISEALNRNPQPGTVIQLPAGTYNANSGENFPLRLPSGVTLRGNPANKGAGITIVGGGRFISPTFADQNATIIPSRGARIEGITIRNNNPRGYGIWVESQPDVQIWDNTFTGNTHDGVFLAGTAVAQVNSNNFVGNTGSGLSAVGSSSGEIRNNLFENTGFGLSIGQRSQVKLVGNRIINNVDGVIITNEATPIFRQNLIEGSQRDGLVVIADRDKTPRPDLGTAGYGGSNIFRNNRLHDIHNLSSVPIAAVGNQLNPGRVKGRIDFNAPSFNAPSFNTPVPPRSLTSSPASVGLKFPSSLRNDGQPKADAVSNLPTQSLLSARRVAQSPTKTIIIDRERRTTPAVIAPISPPITVPARPATDPRTGQALRFRVLVPITSDTDLARIRTIIPDAFRSSRDRATAQIGAYSDRAEAEVQAQRVTPLGLRAIITDF